MSRIAATLLLAGSLVTGACATHAEVRQAVAPPCGPVDSAWAIQLHAVDAATHRPVADAAMWLEMDGARTDSSGWACIRDLGDPEVTFDVERRGYEKRHVAVHGAIGSTARTEIEMRRLPPPCCDLRGRWRIAMHLESPAGMYRHPAGADVSGEVALGPRWLAPQEGDGIDSLVRPVRGLHHVDFTPFFGGPVAPDVSRSIFGNGPDLLHEVVATAVGGDSVSILFIPRMSHGSIVFWGRINRDTIRGQWVQNAYAQGARGRFEMVRTAPPDSGGTAVAPPLPRDASDRSPATLPPRTIPASRWRPELAVAPNGALWLAASGLFVADSLYGTWHRVLGSDSDPVASDELRIGISMAFVDPRTVLVGLGDRYPNENAPTVYCTTDGGAHWVAQSIQGLRGVQSLDAVGRSVWLVEKGLSGARAQIFVSDDGGSRWNRLATPTAMIDPEYLFRFGRDTAYIATSAAGGSPAFWGTTDAGRHWAPVATPQDQGLQHVGEMYQRVSELAAVGRWLVVREAGHVFARTVDDTRWHRLPGIDHVASERNGRQLFALTDSLTPELLDSSLRVSWRAPAPIAIDPGDVEQVLLRNGAGYVSTTHRNVLEASPGKGIRWLAPEATSRDHMKGARIETVIPMRP